MPSYLDNLLTISSGAIVTEEGDDVHFDGYLSRWGERGHELAQVLQAKNGFWAFESSLLVRPLRNRTAPLGVIEWNNASLWKGSYADTIDDWLFFAEDVFGCQYCCRRDAVSSFDPETAKFGEVAASLEDWARTIVEDYKFRTGYPLGHSWQAKHHSLKPGTRLLPKVPFILGGPYEVENLYAADEVKGMLFRASVSNQIRNVPDGGQVILEIVNRPEER